MNDFAHVLDAGAALEIDSLCAELDRKTGAQIAVVTINSLEGAPVEDFANRLFSRWGIGSKKDNRGVLVLLAKADRKYRIEVGYGLEPILPDGKVGGFGREMVPRLRAGDWSGALVELTSEIAGVIASDRGVTLGSRPLRKSPAPARGRSSSLDSLASLVALMILAAVGLLSGILLRPVSGLSRRRYRSGMGWGGPWTGGWGGGFGGGGGGGFGGFGGGISGGGGASGGW